ncbi:MAG: ImmA/IrrE family metallo-endopeptidase [Bradyrhizobium sp.]|nr:ImmA/IrrE family metallo-endopeptidase [Bradyrhizobium sp.]
MQVTRMDLDGAGSPTALVAKILKAEPDLALPIPIEDLARQLDIKEIRELDTEGFEGGLITDAARSTGFILVNRTARGGRRRFTIGHELGHFLMTHHKPPPGNGFRCRASDMRRWSKEDTGPQRWEVEANEFSALILMPPPMWRRELQRYHDPDLEQIVSLAKLFDVSKEAAARAYSQYHEKCVAIIVARDGRIDKIYRDVRRYPLMCVKVGDAVPPSSALFRGPKELGQASDLVEARAELWLQSEWGKPMAELSEQVMLQQNGYALILLWAEVQGEEEEYDPDAERAAKERYRERQARWRS